MWLCLSPKALWPRFVSAEGRVRGLEWKTRGLGGSAQGPRKTDRHGLLERATPVHALFDDMATWQLPTTHECPYLSLPNMRAHSWLLVC
jgi:hypothetical protein